MCSTKEILSLIFSFFLTRWRVLASAPPLSPHNPGGGDGADQDPVPERRHHQRPQHNQETHRGTQGGRAGQGRAPRPGKAQGGGQARGRAGSREADLT